MSFDIERRVGESDFEYKERLIALKTEGHIDLDWAEIIEILGMECSADHFRKVAKGIYESYKDKQEKQLSGIKDKSVLTEIDCKRIALEKERHKLQATKTELTRNLRHESRFELFYENVRDAIEALPYPEIKYTPIRFDYCDDEHVLMISDPHYGAKFKVFGNEYSPEICTQRFETLLSNVIEYVRKNEINHITMLNLGDSLQGILRIGDVAMNDIPVVHATVQYPRLIAKFLNELSSYVSIDYYHTSAANHTQTRPLGSKANELATEDIEYVIINYISDLLTNNDRVVVHTEFADEMNPMIFGIKNFDCIAMHGHEIKNKQNSIKDLSHFYRKLFSYAFFGHDHAFANQVVGAGEIEDLEYIVAPSFVGTCPYGKQILKSSKPAAIICKFTDSGLTGTEKFILS